MTNNRYMSCAGLPRGMWWLITVSALMLLYFLMIFSRQESIESDIKSRVIEDLAAYSTDWLSVELDGRGRDVLLTGSAPSVESRDLVLEAVKSTYGVRIVHDQLDIKPALLSPDLSIQQEDGTILLGGRLASQTSIDAVVTAAKASYGNDKVVNELIVSGQVKTADWLAATKGFLPRLVSAKSAHLKISDSERKLTAKVGTHGERLKLVNGARNFLGDNLDADIAVLLPNAPAVEAGNAIEIEARSAVETETGNAVEPQIVADPGEIMIKTCQSNLDSEMSLKNILFASNTAEVQTASNTLLDKIVDLIEQCNQVVSETGLTIAGHTDSQGDDAYNLALSQRRADAVKAYFRNAGVDVGLINSVGYGESQPVASNDTSQGRTLNRRIEFKLNTN